MVLHGIVLYRFLCTVSHCYVPLLQRAGELPRSASSHFFRQHIGIFKRLFTQTYAGSPRIIRKLVILLLKVATLPNKWK